MFVPNLRCRLRRRGGTDLYGNPIYLMPSWIGIGVVRLEEMSNPTSVRTDSSASRGSAMEEVSLSRVLVPANIRLSQGDELEIGDFRLVVQSVWPRYSIAGKLDHWQLDLTILADGNSPMQLS